MIIQAGDTLLVTIPRDVSPKTAEAIKAAFIAEFPHLESVVVISGVSGLYAYRPNSREIEDS